jgi:hypothetical protein
MLVRYENIKNLASFALPISSRKSDKPLHLGHSFFMNHLPIEKAALNFKLPERNWLKVQNADYPIFISHKGELISFAKYPNGKFLKITFQEGFYPVVNLRINGKKNARLLHRLLANAFIPNPENKPQINHKDGNKWNYALDNLEWVTDQENKIHAHKTGLIKHSRNENCKLSKPIIQYTRQGVLVKEWPCTEEIIRQTGFIGSHIRSVAHGRRKSHKGYIWKFK